MPPKLRPGRQSIRNYRIVRELSKGMFALSYEAERDDGSRVFFKQYKSPMPDVPWYRGFVSYQEKLKQKLKESEAQQLSLECLDSFEEVVGTKTFFQVFEYYDAGKDLSHCIQDFRARPDRVPWERRRTFARVFLSALRLLHESAGIVHCDLKPDNIYLIEDEGLSSGYRVKLIDLDFSIIIGTEAPWHGQQNYVGSPCYQSPEHLDAKGSPIPKSDVFTAALILYELLGQGHPYADEDDYAQHVMRHTAPRIEFQGPLEDRIDRPRLIELLHLALHPDPASRPTTTELQQALVGSRPAEKSSGTGRVKPPRPAPAPPPADRPRDPAPSPRPPDLPPALRLVHESGRALEFTVPRTEVGQRLCQGLGDDARFVDEVQFTVVRTADAHWAIVPSPGTRNETLLNGKRLDREAIVKAGDRISVGREANGSSKLPLTVRIEGEAP